MKHLYVSRIVALMASVCVAVPSVAHAVDPVVAAQPAPKPRIDPAGALREAQSNASKTIAKPVAPTQPAPKPRIDPAGVLREPQSGLSKGNTNTLVNGVKNGNIQQTGTTILAREGKTQATSALKSSGNLSGSNANAISGAGTALANGNTKGATTIALRAGTSQATQALTKATGLSGGLTGALTRELLGGGKGGGKGNATFKQKNDYVAASDDGSIAGSKGGSGGNGGGLGNLTQDLAKLGFGSANKLFAGPDGIIKTATGAIAGRIDQKTGKMFDAAGKEIASNTLTAMRMKESIALNKSSQAPVQAAPADNSGIPAGFGNSNWSDAQRKLEWAKLPFAQQAAWIQEEAVKAAAANANQKISAVNSPDPRTEPRS